MCQLTNHFAMNSLHKTIKISVLLSLVAIGATLAGCASRSSRTAGADSSASAPSSSSVAQSNGSSVAQGSQLTGGLTGQGPIAYDVLMGLVKQGIMTGTPAQ